MEAFEYFDQEKRRKIESAIEKAENLTSGEIRVHIENKCPEEVLDRATYIFDKLQMEKTDERNGILIYLAYQDHKLAILGDVGINIKVPDGFWDQIKDQLILDFKAGNFTEGLVKAVGNAGKQLATYFPSKGVYDKDELDNEITFQNDVE